MVGWPVVNVATILGGLSCVCHLVLEDQQERQEQKWLKKSEENAKAEKAEVEENRFGVGRCFWIFGITKMIMRRVWRSIGRDHILARVDGSEWENVD